MVAGTRRRARRGSRRELRHARIGGRRLLAEGRAPSSRIDYRLKPLIGRFSERPIAAIKTAGIDDVLADESAKSH
jgi:hypothetical protein